MTNANRTKKALSMSILSLLLCFAMLVGTTYAWFTDSVASSGNKIVSGSLKVDFEMHDPATDKWRSLKDEAATIFDYQNWEPGYVDLKLLKVENEGNLSLKWKAAFVMYGEISALADVIDVYVYDFGILADDSSVDYPASRDLTAAGYTRVGTVREFVDSISSTTGGVLGAGEDAYLGIALKMQESAGNEYQNMTLGGSFDIVIVATQNTYENDSFGNTYDSTAVFPDLNINFKAESAITDKIENGALKEDVSVGAAESSIRADIPASVMLAQGAESLSLTVNTVEESRANVVLADTEEKLAVDVHIDGVAEDNTVAMHVTLKKLLPAGLNLGSVRLYHVEDGVTVEMTGVSTLDMLKANATHNEYYYDTLTGDIVLSLASFSEIAVVADMQNNWDGESADAFAGGSGTEADPYLIANASQLAYFRDVVDGKAENWIGDTDFEGQYVQLTNNIYLNHKAEFNNLWDPIGWGYAYSAHNADGAEGKVFRGTFDGDRYAIHGLWQDGWDLEAATGTDYTYTNCGGGLFASVENATIKNLAMINAAVTFECVEIGIVAGLAQGNCTFESIFVYDSKIANYQRATGGVVGEISPSRNADGTAKESNFIFRKVMLDTSVVVGSLWGDFDTPVGGIIGARWDDDDVSTVYMDTCDIACVLDVYNDVTSTYQWYAYRRAGMLIGNTDTPPADGKNSKVATAYFLTCNDVDVYYTNWVNYTYCQFTNYNSSWPWVRVQPGENCNAYSNPRYGVPTDANGTVVTGYNHVHQDGDQCNVQIFFDQLYGGGQGVYGQPEHPGVNTDVKYLITFLHDDHVASIQFIEDNSSDHIVSFPSLNSLPHLDTTKSYEWLDRNGEIVTDANGNKIVPAGNRRDIFYYLTESNKYYANFVDKDGFNVAQLEFDPKTGSFKGGATVPAVPEVPGYYGVWEPYTLAGATHDLIINAVYSKSADQFVITDANALFRLLEEGKQISMSSDLSGNFGNASTDLFCDVGVNGDTTARFDLNSFTLEYNGNSSGNKNWTLFQVRTGSKLTVGAGLAGFGYLYFDLSKLNGNATPCIFHLQKGGELVLERGVVIEFRYPAGNNNEIIAVSGVTDLETAYPGIHVERSNGVLRITVTARTVLVGDGTDAR